MTDDSHRGSYGQLSGYTSSHDPSLDFEFDDSGPHREMAIDVPENFIASIKSPPRYPPPSNANNANYENAAPLKSNKGNISHTPNGKDNGHKSSSKQYKPSAEELDRLQRHQEDLKVS